MSGEKKQKTGCAIVGGGPAGMMLGFLLARSGVDVVVLEKHADFFRDFRGDTIHPSTMELMSELGLLDEFLRQPHDEVRQLAGQIGETSVQIADFSHLPTRCKFLALMPQWDFLNFIAEQARRYPTFHLQMQTEVVELLRGDAGVRGVHAKTPAGTLDVEADLVVACDGRQSTVREQAGLHVVERGAPMDILWFRLSRKPDDPGQTLGRVDYGHILVMLERGDYWQCGFVIRKGAFAELHAAGLDAFRRDIGRLTTFLSKRMSEIRSWDDVKLLTVRVDRLSRWYADGVLCIGDAAHAMSPIGGVGVNLAIQDAVAAANILGTPLLHTGVTTRDLRAVQRRREWPTRLTQAAQVFIQDRVIVRVLGRTQSMRAPWPVRLLGRFPVLRRIPARLVGIGFRPEHVGSGRR